MEGSGNGGVSGAGEAHVFQTQSTYRLSEAHHPDRQPSTFLPYQGLCHGISALQTHAHIAR